MSTVEVIFSTASVLTFLAGVVIVAINPWRLINRSYLVAATLSALWLFSVFMAIRYGLRKEQQDALFWLRISSVFASFLPWSYGLVKLAITDHGPLIGVLKRSWPWLVAGCLLVALVYSDSFILNSSTPVMQKRGAAYTIYVTGLVVLCISILYDACQKMPTCSGVRLLELKFFVINISFCTLLILVSFAASSLFGIAMLRYVGPFVFLISFGLTIWAICYHRVFDARHIFATLSRRFSTLIVLASCVLISDSYLSSVLAKPVSLSLSACCGGLLATYWDRKAYSWLKLDATQILAGSRSRIIEWAREEADANKSIARFETLLRDWCQAESITFHTLESREPPNLILGASNYSNDFPLLRQTGYITVETLARRRPDRETSLCKSVLTEHNLAALIAVPRGSHSPSCVVAFGHKHSLRPYTYPDIQLLIELIELMDNILTHTRVATRTAQIEKLEAAAMMSRGLAHDLNNLATPVSTFLLHMENRIAEGTAEAAVLADAKHSIKVMQDYIQESMFFARRLVPEFKQIVSTDILSSALRLTQERAQWHGVSITIHTDQHVSFLADRVLIQRLLQNLIFNGIDASRRNGSVEVSAVADKDHLRFAVTDHGAGIPAGIMDRIFEPYFTTKDTGDEVRGLGLGLAICRKIVDLHRGRIDVSSVLGQGATIAVILPLSQAPGAIASPDPLVAEVAT